MYIPLQHVPRRNLFIAASNHLLQIGIQNASTLQPRADNPKVTSDNKRKDGWGALFIIPVLVIGFAIFAGVSGGNRKTENTLSNQTTRSTTQNSQCTARPTGRVGLARADPATLEIARLLPASLRDSADNSNPRWPSSATSSRHPSSSQYGNSERTAPQDIPTPSTAMKSSRTLSERFGMRRPGPAVPRGPHSVLPEASELDREEDPNSFHERLWPAPLRQGNENQRADADRTVQANRIAEANRTSQRTRTQERSRAALARIAETRRTIQANRIAQANRSEPANQRPSAPANHTLPVSRTTDERSRPPSPDPDPFPESNPWLSNILDRWPTRPGSRPMSNPSSTANASVSGTNTNTNTSEGGSGRGTNTSGSGTGSNSSWTTAGSTSTSDRRTSVGESHIQDQATQSLRPRSASLTSAGEIRPLFYRPRTRNVPILPVLEPVVEQRRITGVPWADPETPLPVYEARVENADEPEGDIAEADYFSLQHGRLDNYTEMESLPSVPPPAYTRHAMPAGSIGGHPTIV